MNTIKPFQVINGEELMDMDYKPVRYIVKNLLPQGLTILAGAPKTGKSFLALELCLSVSKGEKLWDFETTKGTVLYLCFEDNAERLQNRIYTMTDDAPSNLFFCWEVSILGYGLEEKINLFLEEHKDTVLIVIDTFQCIRPQGTDYSYGTDYKELQILKNIADKFHISILVVHHLRKQENKDYFHMISGTTGIQGASDNCFVMTEKERGSGKVKLYILGRDIEKRALELERNENNIWIKINDSLDNRKIEKDDITEIIKGYMSKNDLLIGEPIAVAKILSEISNKEISHLTLLKRLKKNANELLNNGYSFKTRRSNGKRIIEIVKIVTVEK